MIEFWMSFSQGFVIGFGVMYAIRCLMMESG